MSGRYISTVLCDEHPKLINVELGSGSARFQYTLKLKISNNNSKSSTILENKKLTNTKITPQPSPTNSVQLFCFEVSQDLNEKRLKKVFSQMGIVYSVFIPLRRGEGRGIAFVQMNKKGAFRACEEIYGSKIEGNRIRIFVIGEKLDHLSIKDSEYHELDQILTSKTMKDESKLFLLNKLYEKYKDEKVVITRVHYMQTSLGNNDDSLEHLFYFDIRLLGLVDKLEQFLKKK
ncbi:MAG: hypothetical protein EZS28_015057, partial [Streblomastix strix]